MWSGADETELWARRLGMRELGNSTGEPRQPTAFDGGAHALGHHHRVARLRYRGVEQHRRAAKLHRKSGVRGGADAGIEHHRHRRARADELDQMWIQMPSPEPIGAPSGMTAAAPTSASLRQT